MIASKAIFFVLPFLLCLTIAAALPVHPDQLAVRETGTYYRAIEVVEMLTNQVGHHPGKPKNKPGDFSNQWGYYMFPSKVDAIFWGNQFKTPNQESGKGQFAVVELEWSPPAGVTFYEFTSPDNQWEAFVAANYHATTMADRPKLAGKDYSAIQGPMSFNVDPSDGGGYAQEKSQVTGKPLTQLAIVAVDGLEGVTVKNVEIYNGADWQGGPKPKGVTLAPKSAAT
ncbi:MAG: hypothetical protein NXY57DRAFT_964424 [Lentinula lateritia]|uniref:Uncharacterized protein n=1 Tax=Lentinula lateritia TaxID=40482 RepID=A0A9W9ACE0_9AGAR|nr:MAG: hypothetical protein NXY57DRAFT_964424 [Lentinula lateritia]KAJ4478744.1 hypothetical protein C8J55DRAFT_561107 [Lentinula edodes]